MQILVKTGFFEPLHPVLRLILGNGLIMGLGMCLAPERLLR